MSARRSLLTALGILSWLLNVPPAIHADDLTLQAAQQEYAKRTRDARDAYLSALDSTAAAARDNEELGTVILLDEHRARFLLGLETPSQFVERQPDVELKSASATYSEAIDAAGETLATAYESEIASEKVFDRQLALEKALTQIRSGSIPISPAILPGGQDFVVAKYVGIHRWLVPLDNREIPEELDVTFQAQRFSISGVCMHDIQRIAGKIVGHFGKAVLFQRRRTRRWEQHGYLTIPQTPGRETSYHICLAHKGRLPMSEPLLLEPGVVYEWRAVAVRGRLTVEIKQGDKVFKVVQAQDIPGSMLGFLAVVRWQGQAANLILSYDDTSIR